METTGAIDLVTADAEGPTRWGNQLNGNQLTRSSAVSISACWPHSLGQSVEWKLGVCLTPSSFSLSRPHSLGQSVEWKLFSGEPRRVGLCDTRPHSLGQSVEWKQVVEDTPGGASIEGPHSLGQSVEWKPPMLPTIRMLVTWAPLAGAIS